MYASASQSATRSTRPTASASNASGSWLSMSICA
jgi:hypothetical protein